MNENTLEKVRAELDSELAGRRFGRIFPLSKLQAVIDLRLNASRYLFISVDPGSPRIYLVKRRLRDVERQSIPLTPFFLYLRKRLSGAVVESVTKLPGERILRFDLAGESEIGAPEKHSLVAQLTGRSANLYVLDAAGHILESLRENSGPGQEIGMSYNPPVRPDSPAPRSDNEEFPAGPSISESLDEFYLEQDSERRFKTLADSARRKIDQEISKRKKLVRRLNEDLAGHGDAERWKRFGDLILANLSTAKRDGDKIVVTDYFDENTPEVAIDSDRNLGLTESAEKFFKRYTKARNAAGEIAKRLDTVASEIENLEAERIRIENAIAERDEDILKPAERSEQQKQKEKKAGGGFSGARIFTSSEGYEILVGKKAKDNDHLTFKIAKSLDLWLHAADYPGSHVVVRNPNRRELPHTTLLEAAQLAAFYSTARAQPKVAVHYTQKKFVNKPKGAAPGLVSLASFKTILVEPQVPESVESN